MSTFTARVKDAYARDEPSIDDNVHLEATASYRTRVLSNPLSLSRDPACTLCDRCTALRVKFRIETSLRYLLDFPEGADHKVVLRALCVTQLDWPDLGRSVIQSYYPSCVASSTIAGVRPVGAPRKQSYFS